jgi:hypothetical protein
MTTTNKLYYIKTARDPETGKLKKTIQHRFHKGQKLAWDSRKRFVFVIAGTQSGKTSFAPWWLYREIYGNRQEKFPGQGTGDYLAVSPSYDLVKLKLLPELLNVFTVVNPVGRYWAGDKIIELFDPKRGFWAKSSSDAMWGRIIIRSSQSEGGLESATAKAALLDEVGMDDFSLDDWEAVQRRLSLTQGRVLGTTTPYNLGWLKTQIYDEWLSGDTDIDVINFPSYLNPAFPKAEYDRMEGKVQDWKFSLMYNGIFTKPAGLIYSAFDDNMLVDWFDVPKSWPRVVGLDFGGANTCKMFLAMEPSTKKWYMYDCTLTGDKTTRQHAQESKDALIDCQEYEFVGGAKSESQQRRDWGDNDIEVVEPVISDVESGIDKVTELIKSDRLRVFRQLKGFRSEIGSYRRKLDVQGEPTEQILNKRNFHRMDALRYAAVHIDAFSGYDVDVGNLEEMIERLRRG